MACRPDRAFRIADSRHTLFDGMGALLCGARWNSPGRRIIYAAETFAGALLEMLIHTRVGAVPRSHMWIEVEIPAHVSVEQADATRIPAWNTEGSQAARKFGDQWYEERRSLVLVLPSVVVGS